MLYVLLKSSQIPRSGEVRKRFSVGQEAMVERLTATAIWNARAITAASELTSQEVATPITRIASRAALATSGSSLWT